MKSLPRCSPLVAGRFGSCCGASGGYVLIVTLWVMVLLSTLLTGLTYQVSVETALERRALQQSKLRLAARGAIHMACARLRAHANDRYNSPQAPWWADETAYLNQLIGEVLVSLPRSHQPEAEPQLFGPDDAESRLNINTAEPEHLMGFPGISTVLAESIVRFRRERQETEADGAIDPVLADDQTTPTLVDGPIRSLWELLDVEGVTEQLLFGPGDNGRQPLARFLTSASSGRVNINSAPREVLTAVGFPEGTVNLLLAQRRQGVVYQSLEDAQVALNLVDSQGERWQRLRKFLTVRSSTFHLRAVATQAGSEAEYSAEATVFLSEDKLLFTRWRED